MRQIFREGDWVRHPSYPEPIRVIGVGTTIAVQLPNGAMRAFDPSVLEKVQIARVPAAEVASSRVQTISRAWFRRSGSPFG
jgi:hypothetical protein